MPQVVERLNFPVARSLLVSTPLAFARRDRSGSTSTLTIAHRRDWRLAPMKVRPDVSTSLATSFAYEPRLDLGQPDVIRPSIGAGRNGMATIIIRAVDEDAAHTSGAHLSEGDLLRAALFVVAAAGEFGHAPMIPPIAPAVKPLGMVGLPPVVHLSWISAMRALGLPVRTKRFARNTARQVPHARGDERGASCASPVFAEDAD